MHMIEYNYYRILWARQKVSRRDVNLFITKSLVHCSLRLADRSIGFRASAKKDTCGMSSKIPLWSPNSKLKGRKHALVISKSSVTHAPSILRLPQMNVGGPGTCDQCFTTSLIPSAGILSNFDNWLFSMYSFASISNIKFSPSSRHSISWAISCRWNNLRGHCYFPSICQYRRCWTIVVLRTFLHVAQGW